MIAIIRVENFDDSEYNYVRCPQCHSKLGWKPKDTKVYVYLLPPMTNDRFEPMGLICKRCKSIYLIITEGYIIPQSHKSILLKTKYYN